METIDRSLYGAHESNGLVDASEYHKTVDYTRFWSLSEVAQEKGKITRVRMNMEYGRVDVSYVHATLPNGKVVNVQNGVDNLTPRHKLKGAMIEWAARQGVFAKGLGLLDEANWSMVR